MEDLYERIKTSNLKDSDVVGDLFKEIIAIENDENREDLISALFKHVRDDFFTECMINLPEMDDIYNSIANLREFFVNSTGLSAEEVDRYFEKNDIETDKIVNDMLEKVDIEIEELEVELKDVIEKATELDMDPVEYLEKQIEELDKQKSEECKQNNALIEEIKNELAARGQSIDATDEEITQQIADYEQQLEELYHLSVDGSLEETKEELVNKIELLKEEHERRKRIVPIESQIEELERQILEYKSILSDKNNFRGSLEDASKYGDLENKILDLEINLDNLKKLKNIKDIEAQIVELKAGLGENVEEFIALTVEEIEKKIEELEQQILEYRSILDDENNFKHSLEGTSKYGELENEVADLEIDLECLRKLKNIKYLEKQLVELKGVSLSHLSDEEIMQQIAEYEQQLEELYHLAIDGSLEETKENLIKKIEELKREQERRKNKTNNGFSNMTTEELMQMLQELEEKNKKSQSEIDKKISELKKKIEKLNRLERLKKFKKGGIEREPIPVKKEERKDLLKKCLSAIAGFGVGLGLSAVPGVGTIRMVAASVKLVSSGINFITKKFPEGKIAKIVNAIDEKINNSEIINNFKEKHPKIVNGVSNVKNKIKEILVNKYVNCFINGVSAGYITGNIIEMITGKSIAEHLKSTFDKSQSVVAPNPVLDPNTPTTPTQTTPETSTPSKPSTIVSAPDPVVTTPISIPEIDLNLGEVFDISGLTEGFVSSTSNDAVNLITSAGREAIVDKFVTLPNGEVMVHFKQINGAGYAWFKESVVKEHLVKVAEAAAKTAGKTI